MPQSQCGERGAALVEFALVLPVFLLLVMGMIDFGLTLNDYNSVRQGVREGARQVVVADWDLPGCTSGTSSERAQCVTSSRIDLDPARTRTRIQVETDYEPGEQMTVCSMYQARSTTGMFSVLLDPVVLRSRITMRIEQIDAVAPLTTSSPAPLPGQDWSWC
ncbi:MAG: pilus assembly protein [Actinomycetota bacterium]|nr:pilus assembly protein [Actinomycetota bacterium]